ncbi:MAG TPA: zinc-binding dehydrogenase [Mycobacterium sp.]|nr:zinc-binding dehydrogenase [Mycobacterium sp.]
MLTLFDACAIRVVVDTVVPLCAAPRAQELLESKQTVGKLILDKPRREWPACEPGPPRPQRPLRPQDTGTYLVDQFMGSGQSCCV